MDGVAQDVLYLGNLDLSLHFPVIVYNINIILQLSKLWLNNISNFYWKQSTMFCGGGVELHIHTFPTFMRMGSTLYGTWNYFCLVVLTLHEVSRNNTPVFVWSGYISFEKHLPVGTLEEEEIMLIDGERKRAYDREHHDAVPLHLFICLLIIVGLHILVTILIIEVNSRAMAYLKSSIF
ncbi:hypothetical protein ACJX0J_035154, partial [Zea mays]